MIFVVAAADVLHSAVYACSFNKVLALDENNVSAHHYLGRIHWLRLQDDVKKADIKEACLQHLIKVCFYLLHVAL